MSISITLHVFSGRRNPVWTLTDSQAEEFTERVSALTTLSNLKAGTALGRLGYRGFSIGRPETPFATHILDGVVDPGDMSPSFLSGDRILEEWLLNTASGAITSTIEEQVRSAMHNAVSADVFSTHLDTACPPCVAADARTYTPAKWNTPVAQPHNNCYNYANDQITNTFAQPGRGTGTSCAAMTCSGVQPAAISDDLAAVANFTSPLTPGHGWYVALVVWPGQDYHWYRQDAHGCWSHKPGQTAARNTDNSGATISDPRTCDRGPYTDFCTYMVTTAAAKIR